MCHILCAISGIAFRSELFATTRFHYREIAHPIFSLPLERLLPIANDYAAGNLNSKESYLLYLALFNSTGLVEFRVPAQYNGAKTDQIVANNFNYLLETITTITDLDSERTHAKLNLPRFAITPDTKSLSNTKYWLANWRANWDDYLQGYKSQTLLDKLNRKEAVLERYIKDHTKDVSNYAGILADWAALAGDFPTDIPAGLDSSILRGKVMSLADYWKHIIKACVKSESIFEFPTADILELQEHCEDNILADSIYGFQLFQLLRDGLQRKKNFLNLGDIDIGNPSATTFRILDADASIEDANKLALIDSAPTELPIESNYPTKLAYLRAKMKYDMAIKYKQGLEESSANANANSTNSQGI